MKPLAVMLLGAALALGAARADDKPVNAGPYVPSPQSVVADMLKLADVGPADFVIDLGSGDGRIVLTAAKVFGARGFGVEIQDHLVKLSNEAARREGLAGRVSFINADLFKTDISQATVLTMYLLPHTVNMLKDKLLADLRPGTKILSHDYPLAGWFPERSVTMDLEEKVAISGVTTTVLYLYRVPAKVAGEWTAALPAAISKAPVTLSLATDRVTRVQGKARIGGRDVALEEGRINGETLTFRLLAAGRSYHFSGQVRGSAIAGTVAELGAPWSAAGPK